ncbi:MAG: L-rhamnose mutarotase [Sphingomicrobium sp.]
MTEAELRRYCFALDLADEPQLIQRYKEWHRPGGPPAAVNRAIRAADVRELEIWLTGPRLFMIMDVGPKFDPAVKVAADVSDPDVQAWEKLMWEFQRPLPWAAQGEKWVSMERIYALSDQPDCD